MDDADRKARRLNAYYYSFEPTGCDAVDAVLEAVASAGKAFHHTEDWQDAWTDKPAPVDWIQTAANEAATALREAERRGMRRAAEIVLGLGGTTRIHERCAHDIIKAIEDAATEGE